MYVFCIVFMSSTHVMLQAAQKLSSEPQSSWIPAWLYGYGRKPSPQSTSADTPPPPPPPSIEENKLLPLLDGSPSEEEEELLDEMSEAPTSDTIMRDRILATVSFRLKQGSFELVRSSLTDGVLDADSLLELRFDSLCCSADIRPRLRYSYYNLSLGSLVVSDPLSQEDCAFGFLIQPKVALGNVSDLLFTAGTRQFVGDACVDVRVCIENVIACACMYNVCWYSVYASIRNACPCVCV